LVVCTEGERSGLAKLTQKLSSHSYVKHTHIVVDLMCDYLE